MNKQDAATKIPVTQQVGMDAIQNLLCSAFEGGSNYWYFIKGQHAPSRYDHLTYPGENPAKPNIYKHIDYPTNPDGFLLITANGDEKDEEIKGQREWKLDLDAIAKGLQVMATKYPKHFADAIADDGSADATTGDVFLQCCCFGEIIFG